MDPQHPNPPRPRDRSGRQRRRIPAGRPVRDRRRRRRGRRSRAVRRAHPARTAPDPGPMPVELSRRIETGARPGRRAGAPATTSCSTSSASATPTPSLRRGGGRRHRLHRRAPRRPPGRQRRAPAPAPSLAADRRRGRDRGLPGHRRRRRGPTAQYQQRPRGDPAGGKRGRVGRVGPRPGELDGLHQGRSRYAAPRRSSPHPAPTPASATPRPPDPLVTQAGAAACVDALNASDAGAVSIDLATYDGQPAAIVVVRRADSTTVYAVQRDCGDGDAGVIQDGVTVP